jgi:hypothetical protein
MPCAWQAAWTSGRALCTAEWIWKPAVLITCYVRVRKVKWGRRGKNFIAADYVAVVVDLNHVTGFHHGKVDSKSERGNG